MAWNGSGQVVRNNGVFSGADVWEQSRIAGRLVRSDDQDTHDEDLATAIEDCVNRNGENSANANLPMGGFRHTNVSDAQSMTDYATASQLVNNTLQFVPANSVAGTADAITLAPQISPTSYNAGQRFSFVIEQTNTGPVTINVAGLGDVNLKQQDGLDIPAGAFSAGNLALIQFDGTQFQLMTPSRGTTLIAANGTLAAPGIRGISSLTSGLSFDGTETRIGSAGELRLSVDGAGASAQRRFHFAKNIDEAQTSDVASVTLNADDISALVRMSFATKVDLGGGVFRAGAGTISALVFRQSNNNLLAVAHEAANVVNTGATPVPNNAGFTTSGNSLIFNVTVNDNGTASTTQVSLMLEVLSQNATDFSAAVAP